MNPFVQGGEAGERGACARCCLVLPAGARHPVAMDCIDALKAELAAECKRCGGKIGCLKCSVKRGVRREIEKRAPGLADGLRIVGDLLRPDVDEEG